MKAILFLLLTSYVFAESNFDFSKKFSGTFNGKKLEYTAKVYEKVISLGLSVRDTEKLVQKFKSQESNTKSKPKLAEIYSELEAELKNYLNSKTSIKGNIEGKGSIQIHFNSHDDLKYLIKKI